MKLYNGEELKLGKERNMQEHKLSFEEITKKYYDGQVRIVTEQARYPLNTIVSLVESGNYVLRPDFQRRHRWDNERKSKLIESFIINVPIPPIFLYETTFSKYEVMDGLQRVTAIYEFYNDRFELTGLKEWPELNGYKYSQLPEVIRLGIDRRYLSSVILLQETARDEIDALNMKQLVFERLNSGGVDLSDQEIRNALFNGKLNQLCISLSKNSNYRRLLSIPVNVEKEESVSDNIMYNKMEDVELVLRFFAFRQIEKWDSNYIKKFLDEYLRLGNDFSGTTLSNLEHCFNKTVDLLYAVFGNSAFRLWRTPKGKEEMRQVSKPSKVLFDPLMLVFSEYISKPEKILACAEELREGLRILFMDEPELFISRFNKNDIIRRRNGISKMLKDIIGE